MPHTVRTASGTGADARFPAKPDPQKVFSVFTAAADAPGGRALRFPDGTTFTFAELAERVETCLKTDLRTSARPEPGRPLPHLAETTPEALVRLYAALEAGIPLLLLHPGLTATERKVILDAAEAVREPLSPDAAVVVFTSGTSGRPKPAVLSRGTLLASALSSAANLPLTAGDLWQMPISPARIGGFSVLTRSLLARSGVSVAGHFNPKGYFDRIGEEDVTLTSVVPTMLVKILEADPTAAIPACLRAMLVGGASASPALLKKARGRGIPILTTYGMTETASNVAVTPFAERFHAVGSGRANRDAEIRIEEGRILVRGPMRMTGYWGEKPLDPDAWFDTGDLGHLDAEGNLHVEARRSDLILSGGMNVAPVEVEAALEGLPGIRQALVLGRADPVWGEVVTALLVAEDEPLTDDAVVKGLRPILAQHKSPRRVAWVGAIPTKPGGKPDRSEKVLEGLELRTLHYTSGH